MIGITQFRRIRYIYAGYAASTIYDSKISSSAVEIELSIKLVEGNYIG